MASTESLAQQPSEAPAAAKRRRRCLPPPGPLDHCWLATLRAAIADPASFPPRPEVEQRRRSEVLALRRLLRVRLQSVLAGCEDFSDAAAAAEAASREAFNRWLLERLNDPSARSAGADPLLGGGGSCAQEALVAGVVAALPPRPLRRVAAAATADAHEQQQQHSPARGLQSYVRDMRALLRLPAAAGGSSSASGEALEEDDALLAQCLQDSETWATSRAQSPSPSEADEVARRMTELFRRSRIAIRSRMEGPLRQICEELDAAAAAAATAVAAAIPALRQAAAPEVVANFDAQRNTYFFSLKEDESEQEAASSDKEVDEDGEEEDEQQPRSDPKGAKCVFALGAARFEALAKALTRSLRRVREEAASAAAETKAALDAAAAFLGDPATVWSLTFCVLCRYEALCGPEALQGGGFHAACPTELFDAALSLGGGGCAGAVECFASPMLSRGGDWRFCSLFADLDVYFGSLGSFLHQRVCPEALGGTFEANPPFLPGLVTQMAEKILKALQKASSQGRVLRFVVVLPGASADSVDGTALGRLAASPFACAEAGRPRRRFGHGLAFRSDRRYGPIEVRSRLVYLEAARALGAPADADADVAANAATAADSARQASLQRLCSAWETIPSPVESSGDSSSSDSLEEAGRKASGD
eukprot:TRINITY_DN9175_c0_g1_i1.p1 TRINITY_DN9175_c0_g1~~TRINITY_DN9175_c0_g1_i1.p1  ORF type:complete len:722 (+),score=195.91 TRINITY_DN9175_c0_g1_i1:220-2166(+)